MSNKITIALILSFALAFACLAVFEDSLSEATETELTVNDEPTEYIEITSETTSMSGTNWSYESENNAINLNGANLQYIYVNDLEEITISVSGNNTISGGYFEDPTYVGIYIISKNATITGNGSLNIKAEGGMLFTTDEESSSYTIDGLDSVSIDSSLYGISCYNTTVDSISELTVANINKLKIGIENENLAYSAFGIIQKIELTEAESSADFTMYNVKTFDLDIIANSKSYKESDSLYAVGIGQTSKHNNMEISRTNIDVYIEFDGRNTVYDYAEGIAQSEFNSHPRKTTSSPVEENNMSIDNADYLKIVMTSPGDKSNEMTFSGNGIFQCYGDVNTMSIDRVNDISIDITNFVMVCGIAQNYYPDKEVSSLPGGEQHFNLSNAGNFFIKGCGKGIETYGTNIDVNIEQVGKIESNDGTYGSGAYFIACIYNSYEDGVTLLNVNINWVKDLIIRGMITVKSLNFPEVNILLKNIDNYSTDYCTIEAKPAQHSVAVFEKIKNIQASIINQPFMALYGGELQFIDCENVGLNYPGSSFVPPTDINMTFKNCKNVAINALNGNGTGLNCNDLIIENCKKVSFAGFNTGIYAAGKVVVKVSYLDFCPPKESEGVTFISAMGGIYSTTSFGKGCVFDNDPEKPYEYGVTTTITLGENVTEVECGIPPEEPAQLEMQPYVIGAAIAIVAAIAVAFYVVKK